MTNRLLKYIWPVWAWLAFQISWNLFVMVPTHGDNSVIGNWVYGRDCGHGMCGGTVFILVVGGAFASLFVGNVLYHLTRKAAPTS